MSTDYVDRTTDLIGRVEGAQLLPHAIRLLPGGEPVTLEQLAAAAGWFIEAGERALAAQTSAERDEQGSSAVTAAWTQAHPDGHI